MNFGHRLWIGMMRLAGAAPLACCLVFSVVADVLPPGPQEALRWHLEYLEHLAAAESAIQKQDPGEAEREALAALDVAPPDSLIPPLHRGGTRGASAHFLLAWARALAGGRDDQALQALQSAVQNGFSDPEWMRMAAPLDRVLPKEKHQLLLRHMDHLSESDSYSGKTVADQKSGMSLMLGRKENFPRLGQHAPDFELPSVGGGKIRLSSFRGKKPVVLIFGSFT